MRKLWVVALAALVLTGCASLDRFAGIDPVTGEDLPGPAPAERVADVAGSLWAPAGAVIGGLMSVYLAARRKKYADALKATMLAVKRVREANPDISYDKLVEVLKDEQDKLGIRPFINDLLEKIK